MWELDEYGRPKQNWGMASGMWPENDPLVMNSMDSNPQPTPAAPAAPPAPQVQTQQQTPQDFLKNYGIGTTGPMADQATETAQNYRPETYQGSNQSGGGERYMPQQFGQEGDVYNPEEGPLTPQQTAEAMPTSKDAMQKLINQHMLGPRGGLPKASKEGYDNYVTASRERRAAEKDQLRQQADVNRVQRSARNAETDEAMQRANPGMMGGGGQMSSGNRVQNIGGYTFVKGTWRPQTPEENAKVDLMKANAEYARQRPEIAREGYGTRREIAGQGNQTRRDIAEGRNETAQEIAGGKLTQRQTEQEAKARERAAKQLEEDRFEFDKNLMLLREREGFANKKMQESPGQGTWSDLLDIDFGELDKKTKKYGVPYPGSFNSAADRALHLADKIDEAYQNHVGDKLPDDVIEYIKKLRIMMNRSAK